MYGETNDHFSEISLSELQADPSAITDSFITLVYTYYSSVKTYLFYTYCINNEDPTSIDIIKTFLYNFDKLGMDTDENHVPPLLIILGKHETLRLSNPTGRVIRRRE